MVFRDTGKYVYGYIFKEKSFQRGNFNCVKVGIIEFFSHCN